MPFEIENKMRMDDAAEANTCNADDDNGNDNYNDDDE